VGCQPPQSEFAAALEQFVDGKVPFEDEVAAIFDLGQHVAVGAVKDARFVEQEMHRVGWEFRRGIGSNIAQARNSIGPEGERSDGD
jgi:hypothetical protein